MSDYKPSSIVVSLCKKLQIVPQAEAIRLDGTVVIITLEGKKLIFDKDAITRTLTEVQPEPKAAVVDSLEAPAQVLSASTRRRGKKENHVE